MIIIIFAIIWVVIAFLKEASLYQLPTDTDIRQSIIDSSQQHLSPRETRNRLLGGYYTTKADKKEK